MSFALQQPYWLLVLALILPSAWVGWRWMSGAVRGRRIFAIALRCALIGLVALALAGLERVRVTDRVAVVAVLDVSGSVRGYADFGIDDLGMQIEPEQGYQAFLTRAGADIGADDLLGVVVFDGQPTGIGLPARAGVLDRIVRVDSVSGTDIGAAISRARGMLPADANGRIVLISDGRDTVSTAGSEAVTGLTGVEASVPIDVVPIEYTVEAEVVVESVGLPSRALPESVVDAAVVIRSAGVSRGTLRLFYNGQPVVLDDSTGALSKGIQLSPGRQVVRVAVQLGGARVHRVRAVFEPETWSEYSGTRVLVGDTNEENNAASGITMSSGHGRILVVDGVSNGSAAGVGATLPDTLTRAKWDVQTVSASDFPKDLLEIEQYDLVLLVNTPRDAISERSEEIIGTYVRELGGGVVFVGGPEALGAGGWRGSPIEEIIPVNMDVADDVVMPEVAVMIVLDSSGSMRQPVMGSSRSQQTVANESAAGAIDALDKRDQIGVIAFSNSAKLVVPIGVNADQENTRRSVLAIRSSGGTNMGPALQLAKEQLLSVQAKARHVIVLSDGQSQNAEAMPGLAQGLGEAGIKVTTIAVGDEADARTLRLMASRSGGSFHQVMNPSRLPRVFLKAMRVVRKPMVREQPFVPILVENASPAIGTIGQMPLLGGLVLSEQRDEPLISTPMISGRGEPVFAHHQVELGRVAVFTSDASTWASRWIEHPVFERFWTNVVQWTMRNTGDEPGELAIVVREGRAEIGYHAIDTNGAPLDGLEVNARLFAPDGTERAVQLMQTGPGQYEGTTGQLDEGVYVVIARPKLGTDTILPTIAGLEVSGSGEFMHLSADRRALVELAERTGGRVLDFSNPDGAGLFERDGFEPTKAYAPMWPTLLVLILMVFLCDLAARRVAWDRWIAIAKADTIAATRTVRTNTQRLRSTKQPAQVGPAIKIEQPRRKRKTKPNPNTEPVEEVSEEPSGDENPLLAAKRRARDQFED